MSTKNVIRKHARSMLHKALTAVKLILQSAPSSRAKSPIDDHPGLQIHFPVDSSHIPLPEHTGAGQNNLHLFIDGDDVILDMMACNSRLENLSEWIRVGMKYVFGDHDWEVQILSDISKM